MAKEPNSSSFTVSDLPKPERPRERLIKFGPEESLLKNLATLNFYRDIARGVLK